jgi:hypothetical protein
MGGRRSTLGDAGSLRPEVAPPSLVSAPAGWWERAMYRLLNPGARASLTLGQLEVVRQDFAAQLRGLPAATLPTADGAGMALTERIANTRSLRELWHLRSAVYTHIATHRSQSEAERCLDGLNRHFIGRA